MLAALLLLTAAPAEPAIVVTGVRIETLAADLARCVAARCPPREDIIATVRYAEGLFRTGRYQDAKSVLAKSVGRNKGAARTDPVVVSELYLAQANVANHEGDQKVAREAATLRARVLEAALPDSPATLLAQMGLADQAMRTTDRELYAGDFARAASEYRSVATRARAAGHPTIAAAATLREATLAVRRDRPADAQRLLDQVASGEGEGLSGYRLAARALQARLARERGDAKATDTFIAGLAKESPQSAPILLWSPPLPSPGDAVGLDAFQRTDRVTHATDLNNLGWADIGFTIRPDGSVEQPEVLRSGSGARWTDPVLKSILARRYAPFGTADGAGQYRVERFTVTADYDTPVGSLVRRRVRNPRFERMDITGGVPRKLG